MGQERVSSWGFFQTMGEPGESPLDCCVFLHTGIQSPLCRLQVCVEYILSAEGMDITPTLVKFIGRCLLLHHTEYIVMNFYSSASFYLLAHDHFLFVSEIV